VALAVTSVVAYCCKKKLLQPQQNPEQHQTTTATSTTDDSSTSRPSISITAPTAATPSRPQGHGQVRHDYLRRNPDRFRHLRQNEQRRQQQPTPETFSRPLNNYRYVRSQFQVQQSFNVSYTNTAEFSTGEDFFSDHPLDPQSFFVSFFGTPRQETTPSSSQNTSEGTQPTSDADLGESSVPSDSTLREKPPPSYESAKDFPPAYSHQEQLHHERVPPYSSEVQGGIAPSNISS